MTKDELLALLRKAGAVSARAEYSGSGDDGWFGDVNVTMADGSVRHLHERRPDVDPDRLADAVYDFCDADLDQRHEGYENGDGGCGSYEIDVAAGTIKHDHGWYETATIWEAEVEL